MTERGARKEFKRDVLPRLTHLLHDKPALGEAWSRYLDELHRARRISDKQAQGWDNPFYK